MDYRIKDMRAKKTITRYLGELDAVQNGISHVFQNSSEFDVDYVAIPVSGSATGYGLFAIYTIDVGTR